MTEDFIQKIAFGGTLILSVLVFVVSKAYPRRKFELPLSKEEPKESSLILRNSDLGTAGFFEKRPFDKDGMPVFYCGSVWKNGEEIGQSGCMNLAAKFWVSPEDSPMIFCKCKHHDFHLVPDGCDKSQEEATNIVVVAKIMMEDEVLMKR